MTTSFRLRIALLSALLSGITLSAFAGSAWWLIRAGKLERLSRDVRNQAEREAQRTRTLADWQRVESLMAVEAGIADRRSLALLVTDGAGGVIYRSPAWPSGLEIRTLPWPAAAEMLRGPKPLDAGNDPPEHAVPPVSRGLTRGVDHQTWQIGLGVTPSTRVAVAVNSGAIAAEMRGTLTSFLIALPLCLVLIGVGAWIISNRALSSLKKLTSVARRVTAEGLEQRIPEQGEDREFGEMIQVFNGMLERLERSFRQAQRFSADAAHELRTPLAILQGQIERAIQNAEDGSAAQAELSDILDEVRRLSSISRKLLLLSQADAGGLRVHPEAMNLSELLEELVEDTAMLAPHLLVTSDIKPGLSIQGDRILLPQVLHNLVSNAIKYNVEGGWIRITATAQDDRPEIAVVNSSKGIPLADRERIFDRFFRSNTARYENTDGVGLGLSVSREIARAHGGDLVLRGEEGGTVEFCLTLPVAPRV